MVRSRTKVACSISVPSPSLPPPFIISRSSTEGCLDSSVRSRARSFMAELVYGRACDWACCWLVEGTSFMVISMAVSTSILVSMGMSPERALSLTIGASLRHVPAGPLSVPTAAHPACHQWTLHHFTYSQHASIIDAPVMRHRARSGHLVIVKNKSMMTILHSFTGLTEMMGNGPWESYSLTQRFFPGFLIAGCSEPSCGNARSHCCHCVPSSRVIGTSALCSPR